MVTRVIHRLAAQPVPANRKKKEMVTCACGPVHAPRARRHSARCAGSGAAGAGEAGACDSHACASSTRAHVRAPGDVTRPPRPAARLRWLRRCLRVCRRRPRRRGRACGRRRTGALGRSSWVRDNGHSTGSCHLPQSYRREKNYLMMQSAQNAWPQSCATSE
ncbi:hypothetical protein FA95DRAFT_1396241 [Auriscalpium vulgare]|uniref:Uncharacterized protein n=1 Tax=Auriscalpium vulgare TaxID=40419 RepID=A0ACB8R0Z7_9AGAM|nr:hypothetical protein FA95DRAFT_1396241 [Auriscalpium vulgare]